MQPPNVCHACCVRWRCCCWCYCICCSWVESDKAKAVHS